MAAKKQELEVGGRRISVSNLEKSLFPSGFMKAQVIDFYIRVSPFLLPHLKDRPVTLKRYPDGVKGEHFYEKDAPSFTPDWVKTFPVPRRAGGTIDYILINDVATLVWCANLANLEIHPFLHRAPAIDTPTHVVFDLDPGDGADVLTCAEVALLVDSALKKLKLKSFPKVSGSKGIQLHVPLNIPATYEVTQPFARTLAELLAKQHPDLIVAEMAKALRARKVFIDWSQNTDFKTTVSVYSMRAKRDSPFVSMPVTWQELKAALKKGSGEGLYFEPEAALKRLEKKGDLFAPVLELKQALPPEVTLSAGRRTASARATSRSLEPYRTRRDFTATPEPAPAVPRRSSQGSRRRFVVQKHAASHLHYDFRLEMHNVLKSWAVPKGVPYAADEKRLAMATEDHPIEYLDFEGTIPQGQYGGGTVMVWDLGAYELIEGNYYKGYMDIHLDGKKLKGEWKLIRDRAAGERNWSLVKSGVSLKAPANEDRSAVTGRTMERIAEENDAVWQSNRAASETAGAPAPAGPDLNALPKAEPAFFPPMRAKAVVELPEGANWLYEIKLDGYRALAIRTGSGVKLLSRNNRPLAERFPAIVRALAPLEEGTVLDGEIVALDETGKPSFNVLQNFQTAGRPILFYAFDLPMYRGRDLRGVRLSERRRLLESEALSGLSDPVRLSATLQASPKELVKATREQGLEGLVAKRADSLYEAGQRSGAWVKLRVNKGQELVVGGYMPGSHVFDSLLVGYYEGDRLIFIGKVRNGFVPRVREQVAERFRGLETAVCPFSNLPEPKSARRGKALTAEVMKVCRWLKPELVAEVEFTDWTAADHLRHSKFVGLRDDKDPREVTKEQLPAREMEVSPGAGR